MKKILILSALLILTSCHTSIGDIPDRQTCPEGKTLYQSGDESLLPLFAMIPEEDIYLYAIMPRGEMILYYKGKGTYFDWPADENYLPEMRYYDFDGCGEKEIAVIYCYGRGTGLWQENLHILKIENERIYDNWYWKPEFANYSLLADDVKNWMTEPITLTMAMDNESYTVNFLGESYTGNDSDVIYNAQANTYTSEVEFGDIVYIEFDGTRITTRIAVGAMFEEYWLPKWFGDITADVIFTGDGFRLENYSFVQYEKYDWQE